MFTFISSSNLVYPGKVLGAEEYCTRNLTKESYVSTNSYCNQYTHSHMNTSVPQDILLILAELPVLRAYLSVNMSYVMSYSTASFEF